MRHTQTQHGAAHRSRVGVRKERSCHRSTPHPQDNPQKIRNFITFRKCQKLRKTQKTSHKAAAVLPKERCSSSGSRNLIKFRKGQKLHNIQNTSHRAAALLPHERSSSSGQPPKHQKLHNIQKRSETS